MYQNFQVAISIILEDEDKILIGKRSSKQDFAKGIWEFPAGRMEVGEKPEDTIRREAREELGIEINSTKIIDAYQFDRNGVEMLLLTYVCTSNSEIKKSDEHEELRWVKPEDAKELFHFGRQKKTVDIYLQSR